jgi:YYY domain-containing protein
MELITLIAFLCIPARVARLPLFEAVFTVLVLLPIIFVVLASHPLVTEFALAYYAGILLLLLLMFLLALRTKRENVSLALDVEPIFLFSVFFLLLRGLCLSWPDFVPIGERLRDYALLGSVIKSPIILEEPWFSGVGLNYYGLWYRFGQMMATLLDLETWQVYHQLQSFTFALYLTTAYRLFRTYVHFSAVSSLFCALFISFGSNIAGIHYVINRLSGWYNQSATWWYPSRVIPGVIHEFPAWSFILGDLHPHYLNLPLIPLLIVVFLSFQQRIQNPGSRFLLAGTMLSLPFLLLYNANAWEIPIWFGIAATFVFLRLIWCLINRFADRTVIFSGLSSLLHARTLLLLLAITFLCLSSYISSQSLTPVGAGLKLVSHQVARSVLTDFFQHWGLPLFLIGTALVFEFRDRQIALVSTVLLFALLMFKSALFFLATLWIVNSLRVVQDLLRRRNNSEQPGIDYFVFETLGVSSLAFLMVPELVYLDDPYGGIHERMNTVFKVYSANWFLLHAFAFYIFAKALKPVFDKISFRDPLRYLAQATTLLIFLAFLLYTIPERSFSDFSVEPRARGLSQIDTRFSGAADTIVFLGKQDPGVVLEAQGSPYSYTSHVATLSGRKSFLGWANHINLLYPDRAAELERRKQVTTALYTEPDCEKKRELLKSNSISYMVVGPLERKAFPQLDVGSLKCLNQIHAAGEYRIYSPR